MIGYFPGMESLIPGLPGLLGMAMGKKIVPGAEQSGLLGTVGEVAKPVGMALGLAQQAGLLGGNDKPIQPPPLMQQMGTGAQALGALAQSGQQKAGDEMMMAEQARRMRRQGLLGMY